MVVSSAVLLELLPMPCNTAPAFSAFVGAGAAASAGTGCASDELVDTEDDPFLVSFEDEGRLKSPITEAVGAGERSISLQPAPPRTNAARMRPAGPLGAASQHVADPPPPPMRRSERPSYFPSL
eukprot:scaffold1116_cov103-Isochrysis_galbana.AAC.7